MATAANVNISSWLRQSSTPFYDGNYPSSVRPESSSQLPLTTDVKQLILGHSLINHTTGEGNNLTNSPYWINELALEAGNAYAMSGEFGFGAAHVANLPPSANWNLPPIPTASPLWQQIDPADYASYGFNNMMFTCANFRQNEPADAVNPNWSDITTETTNTLFSWAELASPGNSRYIIYENWQDMSAFTSADFSSTYPTTGELASYWADNNTTFHQWWVDYHDAMNRDYPSLNVDMIPVGYILGELLTGTLVGIPAVDLYEDDAPHGRATLYFLAGLITYMGLYGVKAPLTYTAPGEINSLVNTNFSTIVDEIWDILINFNDADGNSRVFPQLMARDGLGSNLVAVHDYSVSREFTNIAKMARDWVTGNSSTFDLSENDLLTVDANGYVTAFGGTTTHVKLFWAITPSLIGDYVFTYSGTGTFVGGGGVNITSSSAGRIEFSLSAEGNAWFEISSLGTGGNHPRDFVITLVENEATTETFTDDFKNSVSIYDTIRFMDWGRTNNSTVSTWANRGLESYHSWGLSNGVPPEIIFQLCNETNSHCWLCIPHQADDTYVTNLATLALAELNSNLNVYVEYSNEVWNSQFDQATWVETQGVAEYASGNAFEDRINWHGKRTAEVGVLWKAVWTGADTARVTTVLGAQASNTWVASTALACTLDARTPCGNDIDAIAIAPYFGTVIGLDTYEATVETWDETALFSELDTGAVTGGSVSQALGWMDLHVVIADANSKELLCYEGGQHLVGVGTTQNNTTIEALFAAANRDTRMNDRYDTYLAYWKSLNKGLFCHFTHIGSYSEFGNWGSYEQIGQARPPKREALEEY